MPDQEDVQSQQGDEVQGEDLDPRPVFQGDWAKASGKERNEHRNRVTAWKRRHGLIKGQQGKKRANLQGPDAEVAAILGSTKPDAPLTSDAAQILRDIAGDEGQPGSARVSAARALVEEEREATRAAASAERAAATAALQLVPEHERLVLLERIVRRDEEPGWVSILDPEPQSVEWTETTAGAGAAEAAGQQLAE